VHGAKTKTRFSFFLGANDPASKRNPEVSPAVNTAKSFHLAIGLLPQLPDTTLRQ
jgi:hypothetical protein